MQQVSRRQVPVPELTHVCTSVLQLRQGQVPELDRHVVVHQLLEWQDYDLHRLDVVVALPSRHVL